MMRDSVSQVCEKTGENGSRVLKLRVDRSPGSNKVRHDVPVHEWQETFKVDGENGPRVGKRSVIHIFTSCCKMCAAETFVVHAKDTNSAKTYTLATTICENAIFTGYTAMIGHQAKLSALKSWCARMQNKAYFTKVFSTCPGSLYY